MTRTVPTASEDMGLIDIAITRQKTAYYILKCCKDTGDMHALSSLPDCNFTIYGVFGNIFPYHVPLVIRGDPVVTTLGIIMLS